MPQRATLEVVEIRARHQGPALASSSYKPAIRSNGRAHRGAVAHREREARIVVITEDGSYVERANGASRPSHSN